MLLSSIENDGNDLSFLVKREEMLYMFSMNQARQRILHRRNTTQALEREPPLPPL
jgi:hypothetical protein